MTNPLFDLTNKLASITAAAYGIGPSYFAVSVRLDGHPSFDLMLDRMPKARRKNREGLIGITLSLASSSSDFVNRQIIYAGDILATIGKTANQL